jgi:hypothetical protein
MNKEMAWDLMRAVIVLGLYMIFAMYLLRLRKK